MSYEHLERAVFEIAVDNGAFDRHQPKEIATAAVMAALTAKFSAQELQAADSEIGYLPQEDFEECMLGEQSIIKISNNLGAVLIEVLKNV